MANFTRAIASILIVLLTATFAVQPGMAGEATRVNKGSDNVAIKGYDPVAYFTKGQPMKGRPDMAYSWNGANWHFADESHRDMFAGSPERYAPQFGGFCSMALTRGEIKTIDPEAWRVIDGKLYLSFSKRGRGKFGEDTHANIKKAEESWENIRK